MEKKLVRKFYIKLYTKKYGMDPEDVAEEFDDAAVKISSDKLMVDTFGSAGTMDRMIFKITKAGLKELKWLQKGVAPGDKWKPVD